MAFGLKPKDQRSKTFTSGEFFDFVCDYLIDTKTIKNKNEVHEINTLTSDSYVMVAYRKGLKIISGNVLKIYKLKKLIEKLND